MVGGQSQQEVASASLDGRAMLHTFQGLSSIYAVNIHTGLRSFQGVADLWLGKRRLRQKTTSFPVLLLPLDLGQQHA